MGAQQDPLVAVVDLDEEVTIEEEDMIVDLPLEADIVEDIEVDLGATLHTEKYKSMARWSLARQYYRPTESLEASAGSPVQKQKFLLICMKKV